MCVCVCTGLDDATKAATVTQPVAFDELKRVQTAQYRVESTRLGGVGSGMECAREGCVSTFGDNNNARAMRATRCEVICLAPAGPRSVEWRRHILPDLFDIR